MFGDTIIEVTTSKSGNKHEESFATYSGWKHEFPMKRKSEAHKYLSLMFKRYGVTPRMIVDGLKK